jgi:hypothetical protein
VSIRPLIREYLTDLLRDGQDIRNTETANAFIDSHPGEVEDHVAELIRRAVAAEIKALCSEHPESVGQIALFPGLPAAVVVEPGVARPLNRCTWADLLAGRTERVENIAHAEKALDRYDEDLDRLRPIMSRRPELTVADARHLLTERSAS